METDFNYHVSIADNVDEIGLDVNFVTSPDDFLAFLEGEDVNPFYPGCSHESMLSVTNTCNNVGKNSILVIRVPL